MTRSHLIMSVLKGALGPNDLEIAGCYSGRICRGVGRLPMNLGYDFLGGQCIIWDARFEDDPESVASR